VLLTSFNLNTYPGKTYRSRAYQLALRTPGISPLFASVLKQIRQILNLR